MFQICLGAILFYLFRGLPSIAQSLQEKVIVTSSTPQLVFLKAIDTLTLRNCDFRIWNFRIYCVLHCLFKDFNVFEQFMKTSLNNIIMVLQTFRDTSLWNGRNVFEAIRKPVHDDIYIVLMWCCFNMYF